MTRTMLWHAAILHLVEETLRICTALFLQVVIRVRPMFDVEQEAGETYAVQIAPDDPHRLQVCRRPCPLQKRSQSSPNHTGVSMLQDGVAHGVTSGCCLCNRAAGPTDLTLLRSPAGDGQKTFDRLCAGERDRRQGSASHAVVRLPRLPRTSLPAGAARLTFQLDPEFRRKIAHAH